MGIYVFFYFMFVFGDRDKDYIIIDIPLCVCFLGSMIISGILFIYYVYDDFYLSLTYDNPFCLFICCLGLWVYNPCDMGIIELFIS